MNFLIFSRGKTRQHSVSNTASKRSLIHQMGSYRLPQSTIQIDQLRQDGRFILLYSAGGAYNSQCFPDNPKYLITRAPALVKFSGGEYEIQGRVLGDLHQENIPCAVCQANEGRMSLLMIPAQVKCPNSWTTEYVSYLLAGRKTNRR